MILFFRFLGFSKISTLLSWAIICGVAFVVGYRYLQTLQLEANDLGITFRLGKTTRQFAWSQISAIVSEEPMRNGFNKVVGKYPALKNKEGTILFGIDPSLWGSSAEREIFVAFVDKKIARKTNHLKRPI